MSQYFKNGILFPTNDQIFFCSYELVDKYHNMIKDALGITNNDTISCWLSENMLSATYRYNDVELTLMISDYSIELQKRIFTDYTCNNTRSKTTSTVTMPQLCDMFRDIRHLLEFESC